MEGTKVYGASDDLIEADGDFYAEAGVSNDEKGCLLIISDGTLLEIKYGKLNQAIWGITVLKQGLLFEKIEYCENEDADPYSDVVYFKPGIKFIYCASDWQAME